MDTGSSKGKSSEDMKDENGEFPDDMMIPNVLVTEMLKAISGATKDAVNYICEKYDLDAKVVGQEYAEFYGKALHATREATSDKIAKKLSDLDD